MRPDGSRLVPLMAFPYYKSINDADMGAMVAYIRSLRRGTTPNNTQQFPPPVGAPTERNQSTVPPGGK